LLSVTADLRANETSELRWSMVTGVQGQITDLLFLQNKPKRGGREVPLCGDLQDALRDIPVRFWQRFRKRGRSGCSVMLSRPGLRPPRAWP
jgi:hypothetical protein